MKESSRIMEMNERRLSEIEERRAMDSWAALFEYAMTRPKATRRMLEKHTQCELPYPDAAAALYLLGLIEGGLSMAQMLGGPHTSARAILDVIKCAHSKSFTEFPKPCEVVGDRRKYFRPWGQ